MPIVIDPAEDGRALMIRGALDAELLDMVSALPGARPAAGDWLVPASGAAAHRVLELLRRRPELRVHGVLLRWLDEVTRWRGVVTIDQLGGAPWFAISADAAPPGLPEDAVRHGRTWWIPMEAAACAWLTGLLETEPGTVVDPLAARCLQFMRESGSPEPPPPAVLTVDPDAAEPMFAIEVLWDPRLAEEADGPLMADEWAAQSVADLVARTGIGVTAAARALLDRLLAAHAEARELVELSRARAGEQEVGGLAGELMPFQAAGVQYALRQRRVLLSDEQGLGKTVQALAAVEADGAYPAVVVCPASLKLNWAREARRWLPGRRVGIVDGSAGDAAVADGEPAAARTADLLIVNYERVGIWLERADALAPRALIVDESHYCKNSRAQRTRDVLALSRSLAPDALRLALTGTPVVNRPAELVAQLRILDRLRDFGDGESFAERFGHAAARERLHWHLRRRCYVRRLKRDVLEQLPPKRRVTIPLEIDNRPEYDALEEDLIGWIRAEVPDRLDAALRAQALVKVGALRRLTARGKLGAALEWLETFAASGEKLVVFAHHREVQDAVLRRFPAAARVLGVDRAAVRDANVRRFQEDPDATLCVCSLEVAAHGFTLTAAADAAFLELGWTPAGHDQAEDRVHRITQDRAVTAWYLLAADTIDERIAALIDHKRTVVGSVTDGAPREDRPLLDSLLAGYATPATGSSSAIT